MILLTLYAVTESKEPDAGRIDIAGLLTFTSSLFLTTFALISANHHGWARRTIVVEMIAAALLFVAFLVVEARQERPMLDLRFFRDRTDIGAHVAGLAFAAPRLGHPKFWQRLSGGSVRRRGVCRTVGAACLAIGSIGGHRPRSFRFT